MTYKGSLYKPHQLVRLDVNTPQYRPAVVINQLKSGYVWIAIHAGGNGGKTKVHASRLCAF